MGLLMDLRRKKTHFNGNMLAVQLAVNLNQGWGGNCDKVTCGVQAIDVHANMWTIAAYFYSYTAVI